VAAQHPEIVAQMRQVMREERRPMPAFPLEAFDGED
jgi:hypothetical protein